MEALGNVNVTCPPLRLINERQLISLRAKRLHLGADEAEIRAWLEPHVGRPLLFFGRMFRRFGRFTTAADDEAFKRRYAAGVRPAREIQAVANAALRNLRAAIRDGGGGQGARYDGSVANGGSAGDDGGRGANRVSGSFDCVHMRRRDFLADHAEENTVAQCAASLPDAPALFSLYASRPPPFRASFVPSPCSPRRHVIAQPLLLAGMRRAPPPSCVSEATRLADRHIARSTSRAMWQKSRRLYLLFGRSLVRAHEQTNACSSPLIDAEALASRQAESSHFRASFL